MFCFDFVNGVAKKPEIFYSQFIASWNNVNGGPMEYWGDFREWLNSLGCLSEEEIKDICQMATAGKLELEENARRFLKEKHKA